MRKIELMTFLKWAFGEELIHLSERGVGNLASSHAAMLGYASLGAKVDTSSFGQVGLNGVHPDALALNDAVMLLAAEKFDLPEGWNPFPDLDDPHGLIASTVEEVLARRRMRDNATLNANMIALVISCSIMGKEPEWRVAQPKFRMIARKGEPSWFVKSSQTDTFGRVYEFESDGFDPKSRRPKPGAYRKYELSSSFAGAVQGRVDWYLWSKAIGRVAERLKTGLVAHQITPFVIDCEIWKNVSGVLPSSEVLEMAEE